MCVNIGESSFLAGYVSSRKRSVTGELWSVTKKSIYNPEHGPTHTHIYYIHTFGFGTVDANPPKLRSAMERGCIALFIIFLFVLCFPISSDSQKLSPSISLHDQEQAHGALTALYLACIVFNTFIYLWPKVFTHLLPVPLYGRGYNQRHKTRRR